MGANSKDTLWTGSDLNLTNLNAIDNTSVIHKAALTPEYPLLNNIKQATVRLGGKLERRWVESHQNFFFYTRGNNE